MKHKDGNRVASRQRRVAKAALLMAFAMLIGCFGVLGSSAAGVSLPSGSQITRVYVDGEEVLRGECALINSVTYVPLRRFCSLFADCRITWNSTTNTATVKTDDLTLIAQTGALYITANGHYYYTVEKILKLYCKNYIKKNTNHVLHTKL